MIAVQRKKSHAIDMSAVRDSIGIFKVDSNIEQLHQRFNLPVGIRDIIQLANDLNARKCRDRVQPVKQFLTIDRSLGLGGYLALFDGDKFSFFYVQMYGNVYRPIMRVYMNICQTISPANHSRAIVESSCEHMEQCLRTYLDHTNNPISKDNTIRKMLAATECLISTVFLDDIVHCKIKHGFQYEQSRDKQVAFTESIILYFVCRSIGITLLEACGAMNNIANEILRGQTYKGVLSNKTVG